MDTPQRLPKEEWKFDELSDDKVRGAFFYEFFRHSPKLRNLVLECRSMKAPPMVGDWPKGYVPLSLEGRHLLQRQLKNGTEFEYLVEALMNCPAFPEKAVLLLTDKDWVRELMQFPAVRLCEGVIDPDQEPEEAMKQIIAAPGANYKFKGGIQAKEYESVLVLVVDWRWPNPEIQNQLAVKTLAFRPDRFGEQAKGSPKQTAFGNLCERLPFKPSSALCWLGVLRRREAVNTWREYFECYEGQNFDRGDERAREEDCRKARLILDCLASGQQFKRKDFE